ADRVLRVEVIRGTVAGLDVRSEGTIVNVVLKDELSGGSGAWEARLAKFTGEAVQPGGRLSYSGETGPFTYIAGLEVTPRFFGRDRWALYYMPDNPPRGVPDTPPF